MRTIILAALLTASGAALAQTQDPAPPADSVPRTTQPDPTQTDPLEDDPTVDPVPGQEPMEMQTPPAQPQQQPMQTPPTEPMQTPADPSVPTAPMPEDGTNDPMQPAPPATGEQQPPPEGTNIPAPVPAPGQPVVNTGADAFAPRPATQDYPVCSRTVTDNCTQARDPK